MPAASALAFMPALYLPRCAPLIVFSILPSGLPILRRARRAAFGTALGAAVNWGLVTIALAWLSQAVGAFESLDSGRPWSGHLTYLTSLALLAALISVLNARTPGGAAWAILMALLMLVFLIPWLEGPSFLQKGRALSRLRLDAPWSIFYGLLIVAGVTNYLPTRYFLAAIILFAAFWEEAMGLVGARLLPSQRALIWWYFPYGFWTALVVADSLSRRRRPARSRLDAIWLWFRDHWGVVWAIRVQERFNRSAESLGWPIRLTWHGVMKTSEAGSFDFAIAEETLIGLLRRFATPERIAMAVDSGGLQSRWDGRGCTMPDD